MAPANRKPRDLAELRARKHLTQHDLAKQLNTRRDAIARWESGLQIPSPMRMKQLAVALGTTARVVHDAATVCVERVLHRYKLAVRS